MKKIITVTAVFLLVANTLCLGQQMKQQIGMRIDSIGNAVIKVSMKMNAAAWQAWLQSYGNNPAALKRQMEKEMPAYFLGDFRLEKNDMERSFDFYLKAYGVCKVDKKGNWILETEDKDVEMTELSDRKYMFVASPTEFGGQIQQTNIIEFPEEAQNISVDKDAYGKTVFKFKMDSPGAGFNMLRWAGIVLILAGAVWTGANFYTDRSSARQQKHRQL